MLSSRARTSVAVQACETCRRRKTKCDEQRPECSLCERLNLECRYKEAESERKDEAMVRVIETLQRLEIKVDNISTVSGSRVMDPSQSSGTLSFKQTPRSGSVSERFRSEAEPQQGSSHPRQPSHSHLTVPHRIIFWPRVYSELINSNPQAFPVLQAMSAGGTPWLIRHNIRQHERGLPFGVGLPCFPSNASSNQAGYTSKVFFPVLTSDRITEYTNSYFGTFNLLYPILDYGLFMTDTLAPLLADGFGYGDASSVLALLVFALGELAIDGVSGAPITTICGVLSGICGGTPRKPPGLEFFNEARARLASITFLCDPVDIQVQLLQASYFEANACHVEYWRSTVAASMACQVLAQRPGVQWSTHRGDLIKRAYWTCIINEDLYHHDLDLPQTTIHDFEDIVPFPHFHEAHEQRESDAATNFGSVSQYHFLAKAALKRVITRIHDAIHLHSNQSESLDDYRSPPIHVMAEMGHQLDSWRAWLPTPLQWSDDDVFMASDVDPIGEQVVEPPLIPGQSETVLEFKSGLDMPTAELRTRFYYARFILYRPFIFKALHLSELMSAHDAQYCAFAIRAACLWPVTMAPTRQRKRLVPHLFAWTQNFIGILLVLWMSQNNECLNRICEVQLDGKAIEKTIALMLHWIKDIKQIDGIAEWSWQILEPLFPQSR